MSDELSRCQARWEWLWSGTLELLRREESAAYEHVLRELERHELAREMTRWNFGDAKNAGQVVLHVTYEAIAARPTANTLARVQAYQRAQDADQKPVKMNLRGRHQREAKVGAAFARYQEALESGGYGSKGDLLTALAKDFGYTDGESLRHAMDNWRRRQLARRPKKEP